MSRKIKQRLRWGGLVAPKPQRHSALPLDKTAFSEAVLKRFWVKIEKRGKDECWPWLGSITHDGYGRFGYSKNQISAHRMAFRVSVGEIPSGLLVCHHCDNPTCVNPDHLWLGTVWDNHLDMIAKGRNAKGDRNGSRLHPESVLRGNNHPFRTNPECHPRGERVNTAKLKPKDVKAIRRSSLSRSKLADMFGVSWETISDVQRGRTWRHLL